VDQILAMLAVFIGWGLNEFSHVYRSSKEHKQAIAHALSILLDVRFQAIYLENLIPILKELGIPSEEMPIIRTLIDNVGLGKDGLSEEYEEALEIVAKNSPLVAYEYRSRASFPQLIKKIRGMALEGGMNPAGMELIESNLHSMIIPRMDELVISLASLHSKKLKTEVEAIVNKEFKWPEGMDNYFAVIQEANKLSQGTQQSCASS
jgi:hypothetical protein